MTLHISGVLYKKENLGNKYLENFQTYNGKGGECATAAIAYLCGCIHLVDCFGKRVGNASQARKCLLSLDSAVFFKV